MKGSYYRTPQWKALRLAVLKRDGFQCTNANCTTPTLKPNVHHRVDRRDGGTDSMSNLRTLCQSCHSRLTGYSQAGVRGASESGVPNKAQPAGDSWKRHRFD